MGSISKYSADLGPGNKMCIYIYLRRPLDAIIFFKCNHGLIIFKHKFLPAEALFKRCCSTAETEELSCFF